MSPRESFLTKSAGAGHGHLPRCKVCRPGNIWPLKKKKFSSNRGCFTDTSFCESHGVLGKWYPQTTVPLIHTQSLRSTRQPGPETGICLSRGRLPGRSLSPAGSDAICLYQNRVKFVGHTVSDSCELENCLVVLGKRMQEDAIKHCPLRGLNKKNVFPLSRGG